MANLGFSVCVCLCVYMCVFHVGVHMRALYLCCCVCLYLCACMRIVCCCVHWYALCMCMCARVLVHVCVLSVCVCALHVHACVCVYVHYCCVHWYALCMLMVHVCVLCVHACVPVCAFICTVHMCVGACMCAVRACVCVHMYTCVLACCTHVPCMPDQCVTSHVPPSPPQSAIECSSLLRTLHGLEQEHLRRSLALQQEEDFAKAHRQLAIFQRNELHGIFFTQIKSAIFKGELKPEAAKMLLQDYSKIQVMPQMRLSLMEESFSWTVSVNFSSFWAKSCLFFCAGFQWTNAVFLRPLDAAAEFPVSRANGGLKHRP